MAKAWINATLGKGSPVTRWCKRTREDCPKVDGHDAKGVGSLVLARYPFLVKPWSAAAHPAHLGDPKRLLHHLLTGVEAAMLTNAMAALSGRGVLSLSMHDGLIVPASAEVTAKAALMDAGRRVAGVALTLTVDRAEPEPCERLAAVADDFA